MKKLLALLIACMTITCTFAACGDTDDGDSSSSSKSSSSKSKTDDEDEEDDDKDDDDEDDEDEDDDDEDDEDEDDDDDDEEDDDDKDDDKDEDDDEDDDKDDDDDKDSGKDKDSKDADVADSKEEKSDKDDKDNKTDKEDKDSKTEDKENDKDDDKDKKDTDDEDAADQSRFEEAVKDFFELETTAGSGEAIINALTTSALRQGMKEYDEYDDAVDSLNDEIEPGGELIGVTDTVRLTSEQLGYVKNYFHEIYDEYDIDFSMDIKDGYAVTIAYKDEFGDEDASTLCAVDIEGEGIKLTIIEPYLLESYYSTYDEDEDDTDPDDWYDEDVPEYTGEFDKEPYAAETEKFFNSITESGGATVYFDRILPENIKQSLIEIGEYQEFVDEYNEVIEENLESWDSFPKYIGITSSEKLDDEQLGWVDKYYQELDDMFAEEYEVTLDPPEITEAYAISFDFIDEYGDADYEEMIAVDIEGEGWKFVTESLVYLELYYGEEEDF